MRQFGSLEFELTCALCLFTLRNTIKNNCSKGVVTLVDVWLSGKFCWVSFFSIYSVETPGIQRSVLNFIGLATDSHQPSSRELSLSQNSFQWVVISFLWQE